MTHTELLNRLKSLLADAFGDRLRGVVLYGSEARGEAQPDSDIDVLVLLEGPVKLWDDLGAAIHATYPLVLELGGRPIDIKPVDAAQYEAQEWPLYQEAKKEGLVA